MRLGTIIWRKFILALFSFGFISVFVFLITKNNWINHDEYKKSECGDQKATENNIQSHLVATDTSRRNDSIVKTKLEDVFISIKTTSKFHKTRLGILANTWIPNIIDQVYVFTDADDIELQKRFPANHVTNTHCPPDHSSKALSCKMAYEFTAITECYSPKLSHWFLSYLLMISQYSFQIQW